MGSTVRSEEGRSLSKLQVRPPVSGDSQLQSATLESLTAAVNYREWLASLALPWLGRSPIEVGSGIGDYAATWASMGFRMVASEADDARLAHLRARFADDALVDVMRLHAPVTTTAEHSSVVAYNVLEHIEDDVAALRGFRRLIHRDGFVILVVPAFPVATSAFDIEIGHHRRYRAPGLTAVLTAAELEVVELRYVNPFGLVAWIASMRVLRQRPRPGPALRAYDRMVPTLRRLEAGRRPPFGQSLFAVARPKSPPR